MRYLQFRMRYISEIWWMLSWDVCNSEFLLYLLVCQLAYFLTEIRLIQEYHQFQKRDLSRIFWRHSWHVPTLVPTNLEFLVCLLVCQLAYSLTEMRSIWLYLQYRMRYISEFFWRLSWNVSILDPNNLKFLVCMSVCQLAYSLTYLG